MKPNLNPAPAAGFVWKQLTITLLGVFLMAFMFAQVEIQIEGAAGWAAALPTWHIERHWLLDVFFGGRPLTGYHAWIFPCVALFFHFPFLFNQVWSMKLEARAIACIMLFWIIEDFLWFVMNPAYGLALFDRAHIPWHVNWLWVAPTDYWTFSLASSALFFFSFSNFSNPSFRPSPSQ